MKLREHGDAVDFLAAAAPVLEADEPRHNLGFGICSTLIESPTTYPTVRLWTVETEAGVVAAALMTPPYNLWFARPLDDAAIDFLAGELAHAAVELPGVTAALPEVDAFADAWQSLTGVQRRLRHGLGVYKASAVQMPVVVPGKLRDATVEDRPLLVEWMSAFEREALDESTPSHDIDDAVGRRLERRAGGLVIWDDPGPVAFAGYGGTTPNGVRIGPVYTPPEHRRHGYGSALTAALSRRLLDEGRSYCFLYTDLGNPTSNRIYQAIGYEFVCESAEYGFV
jgi:uncharacterized protein